MPLAKLCPLDGADNIATSFCCQHALTRGEYDLEWFLGECVSPQVGPLRFRWGVRTIRGRFSVVTTFLGLGFSLTSYNPSAK